MHKPEKETETVIGRELTITYLEIIFTYLCNEDAKYRLLTIVPKSHRTTVGKTIQLDLYRWQEVQQPTLLGGISSFSSTKVYS